MQKQVSPKIITLTFGVLVICFAVGFYVFAWTGAPPSPPNNNTPAPINTGSEAQTKQGNLTIGTATIKGDGSISTNLNSDKVDSLHAADLMAAGGETSRSIYKRIFITSTGYNGNLGGISGANAKCQAKADAANLGGTWKALIADSSHGLGLQMPAVWDYLITTNGALFIKREEAMTVCGITPYPIYASLTNEYGGLSQNYAWTGVAWWNNYLATSNNCDNWTSTNYSGRTGHSDSLSYKCQWIGPTELYLNCNNAISLYCVEQ